MENIDLEDQITLSALKFVCGEDEHICRLCLSPTENKDISVENTVKLQTIYYENSITYRNMLEVLNVSDLFIQKYT